MEPTGHILRMWGLNSWQLRKPWAGTVLANLRFDKKEIVVHFEGVPTHRNAQTGRHPGDDAETAAIV